MPTEIERKFLLRDESWRDAVMSRLTLVQAYVMSGPDRSLRVRTENDSRATLCVKIGGSSLSREEFQYPIPLDDARDLIARAEGIVLEKTRHLVHFRGHIWEIDTYGGIYEGLAVAEVELEGPDDAPPLPTWAGLEVTDDRRYSNASLAAADLSRELVHAPSP